MGTNFENYVAVAFALFLVIAGACVGAALAFETRRHSVWDSSLFAAGLLGGMFLDLPYLGRLWVEICRNNPQPSMTVAIQQPRPRIALRPVIAIWWLSHFAIGCAFAVQCERLAASDMTMRGGVLLSILAAFLSFGGAYAANGFLAMAVGALWSSEHVIAAVWRRRILIDAGVALVALVISMI